MSNSNIEDRRDDYLVSTDAARLDVDAIAREAGGSHGDSAPGCVQESTLEVTVQRLPAGLVALTIFFVFGAVMSGVTAMLLLLPGTALDAIWRLNPVAHDQLAQVGPWAIVLMLCVCAACAFAAIGLAKCAAWGHRLAVGILVVNLIGDVVNAVVNSDPRTLIGIPVGGALIAYLMMSRVRRLFTAYRRD